ncbi:MAG: hypothetical protein WCV90_05285 [Candidatus Woesearchaeota archaeon]|jgi:hypothetical protein
MKSEISKPLYWAPRIMGIIFILFLALFSLDVFGNGWGFWYTLGAFLMHNIPSFLLTIILIISWKYEIVGGIAFILAGIAYIVSILVTVISNGFEWYYLTWAVQISGIAFLVGILFLVNWYKK